MVDKVLHQLNAPKSVRYSAKLLNTRRVETDINMCMREEEEHPEPSINQRMCVGSAAITAAAFAAVCIYTCRKPRGTCSFASCRMTLATFTSWDSTLCAMLVQTEVSVNPPPKVEPRPHPYLQATVSSMALISAITFTSAAALVPMPPSPPPNLWKHNHDE